MKEELEEGISPLNGQYKSSIICSECGNEEGNTENFMFLSLPIPKYKEIEYTFINGNNPNDKPKVFGATLLKTAPITELKRIVARNHGIEQLPFASLQHLDKKYIYPIYGYIRDLCDLLKMQMLPDLILFTCISFHYDSSQSEIFICDVWKSKIHRELRRNDSVVDINRKSDDILVYHSRAQNLNDWKSEQKDFNEWKFQTFVVINQHRVLARQQYMHGGQQRWEDEPIGFPLLITLPVNVKVTYKQIYQRLWNMIQPYIKNKELNIESEEKPLELWAAWGFNKHQKIVYSGTVPKTNPDNEDTTDTVNDAFDLHKRNLKFLIHWSDAEQYEAKQFDRDSRVRDKSAPAAIGIGSRIIGFDDMEQKHEIDLIKTMNTYFEEQTVIKQCINAQDLKPCESSEGVRCIKLIKCPDLLVVHLQRFTDGKSVNLKETSNTLVKLPLDGLDMKKYLDLENMKEENIKDEKKKDDNDCIYDCFAISNHNNQWGVNTAYVRNRENDKWCYLDKNGSGSLVNNTDHMMTSEAYIAYYLRRNSKLKENILNFNLDLGNVSF